MTIIKSSNLGGDVAEVLALFRPGMPVNFGGQELGKVIRAWEEDGSVFAELTAPVGDSPVSPLPVDRTLDHTRFYTNLEEN